MLTIRLNESTDLSGRASREGGGRQAKPVEAGQLGCLIGT